MFRQNISSKFSLKSNINKSVKRVEPSKDKQVEVVKLPSPILARLSKEILKKLKLFNKKGNTVKKTAKPKTKQLYTQASTSNVGEILKLKENFSNLLAKKIKNIYKTINMLWNALNTNNFYFILFYFSDFILILFCFVF